MSNILIASSGGIAAYKTPLIVRLLKKQGHNVRCVLTKAAEAFVSPMTLQALTGETVRSELFDPDSEAAMGHIELARWADILLVAPATANTIAKLTHGIADDLLTTLYLATTAKVIIAPAMNHQMWLHPATTANIKLLSTRPRHRILPVGVGAQACGENGPGRLLEPEQIVSLLNHYLSHDTTEDLTGLNITITAGPTREAIDPVRYLSNRSSGKMGYALAQAAQRRGANVTLISGPTNIEPPLNVTFVPVISALEMLEAANAAADNCDLFIGAAAVSDYRIDQPFNQKQKKTVHGHPSLTLVENPDIIATIASRIEKRPYVVGFAAETENVVSYAQEKLHRKKLNLIIANDVSNHVFGADENEVHIISADEQLTLERQPKSTLANTILTQILNHLNQSNQKSDTC